MATPAIGNWEQESEKAMTKAKAGQVVAVRYMSKAGEEVLSLSVVVENKSGTKYLRPGCPANKQAEAIKALQAA